ncbi:MAG TPA: acetyl-CoA synthetase [Dehalococcoidia bacterium]|nr:acetyl-CoA synthetase [Dehalococcoidia bacterium]
MGQSIAEELEPLFNPKSVAVIGATNNWSKWGYSTFTSVLDGFRGPVYPVNNKEGEILGYKAYARVTEIPGPVDLAVFVIPAASVAPVMDDCVTKGVKAAVIITAGFAETGEEGKKLQDEVLRIARKGGIRFIGPNCMGFWSASSELRAFMFPLPVKDGPLAFVSQGGNVGGAVVTSGYMRGIGFHHYVSCGCAADIQIEDYIEYFGEDPQVKVILAYVEGLADGIRFLEKVKKVTPKKPVIVLKPGKTDAAAKAITSHSGALAGSDEAYEAAFRSIGITRVESPEELLDVAIGFITQPLPRGRNIAILTPGGSYGVLCAEACASEGLNVVKLPDKVIAALDKVFPPRWSRGNPVDPAGDRNFVTFLTAPGKLLKVDEVDSLIFMGFGGFSIFAALFLSADAEHPDGVASWVPSRERFRELAIAFTKAVRSRDTKEIGKAIHPIVSGAASIMGIYNEEEVAELTQLVAAAIASGRLNAPVLVSAFLPPDSPLLAEMGIKNPPTPQEAIARFLVAIAEQWVEDYKKPVLTTTFFTEDQPRLRGSHYAYPSGKQAARVLVKLVEYKEYLESIGLYKN